MTQLDIGSRVWLNGKILNTDQASVAVGDRGFTLGDGLFETLLWTGSKVRFLDDHMARLANSCHALGFVLPCNFEHIGAGLTELGADSKGQKAALRLTLSRGTGLRGLVIPDNAEPILIGTISPLGDTTAAVRVKTVRISRHSGAPSACFKTLSYIDNIMALHEARLAGFDDAIMLGTTGNIACASSANLILRHQGLNLTPALEDGALPGIIRARLIRAGLVKEARVSPAILASCDAAALTNALIGIRKVSIINANALPEGPDWTQTFSDALNIGD